ncbi:hypothetical protein PTSG_12782 [Salpingoeca rosetta]|uniref:Uncharacterized protein n=1 Tax=Salpingoeca rosetta (strain ATCC 50818 / BSB-021) TaxID=946362 RepID=F2UKI5_SALR5|nr:uncharacterized protein PTSG_12782 [Salpingoeca rosetta]EGD77634.1 hypothetical protein PTSG_12782 [Salpingoeca rosetta]|eukprot:XP_004990110.1 hypothetical protein PTSG_12782 [Salpingoeca rosetta]
MQQQQRMHHHHRLPLNTFPSQPTNQPTHRPLLLLAEAGCLQLGTGGDSTSCIFGWKQQQRRRCTLASSRMREMSRLLVTRARCTRLTHGIGLACRLLLCSCSVPICVSKEQLWTHTSMVMVATSNHSDAVMRSSAVTITTIIAIDCTAAITRRPTPAPIWREADIAHVTRSDEEVSNVVEEAHEAVEPTKMTMTSDAAPTQLLMCGCILDELALCLLSISSCSSSSSLVANSSGCDHGCGGCDVRRCAVASHDDDDGGGRWPFSSQALMTRPERYTHTRMCQKRRRKLLRRDRDCGQRRHSRRQASSLLLLMLL